MSCCGDGLRLQHGAGLKITYSPGKGFSFADLTPLMRIWQGEGNASSPLLTLSLTPTGNGSGFDHADAALQVTLEKPDVSALPVMDDGFYDIVLTDLSGFVNPFLGGSVTVEADGSASLGALSASQVVVSLSGQQVPVVIQGGGLSAAMNVALGDLNQAVLDAAQSASEAAAAEAAAVAATVNKADKDGGNITAPGTFRGNIAAVGTVALAASTGSASVGHTLGVTGATARTAQAKLRETVSVKDFGAAGDGVADDTAAFNAAIAYANAKGGIDRANIIGTTFIIPMGRYRVGQLNPITVSHVDFQGSGTAASVLLHSYNGPTFTWGGGTDTIVGGGMSDVRHDYLSAPGANAALVKVDNVNTLNFTNWHVNQIGKALVLGESASRIAGAIFCRGWCGSVYNMDTPVWELKFGAGLFVSECALFVAGVVAPPIVSATTANGSPTLTAIANTSLFFVGQTVTGPGIPGGATVLSKTSTTVTLSANATASATVIVTGSLSTVYGRSLFKCLTGFWDTLQTVNCLFERFDQGLGVVTSGSMVYQNIEFCNTKMDYFRRWCIYAEAAGGVISGIRTDSLSWFVSWETDAITMQRSNGIHDEHDIQGIVPLAGGAAVSYSIANAKHNSFALNIGAVGRLGLVSGAMTFAASSTGFTVSDCKGNDDLTAYGTPWRTDWGITLGANCDDYTITGNRLSGASGFLNYFAANSAGSANRRVYGNGRAGYAVRLVDPPYQLPSSGTAWTNVNGFTVEIIISGGTVSAISKNGTSTGLTSGVFLVQPGDTLTTTYSSAPTMLFYGQA